MKNTSCYEKSYYMPEHPTYEWVKKDAVERPPIWCSVDLRDGNQALMEPMSLEEKLEFFHLLTDVGFKEIEVGFPAASETEYQFIRTLIEQELIPEDVTIQVLTQAREHIIRKTFEAVKGAPHAVIHLYNSTSTAQREQVFKKNKEEIKKIAVDGAKLLKKLSEETEGNFSFEYSTESFSGTEIDYAIEVYNAVLCELKPTREKKVIVNISTTVENAMPHVFATQLEYIQKNLVDRDKVIISIHPHNDRGCGVATAELGLLAGADRLEGTLFGNGERTGNVDLITVAMNMYSQGVEPGLDFSNMKKIRGIYESCTRMTVPPRQPYSGDLVFTAFSGSHQDAISKGIAYREKHRMNKWKVPYLPINPEDIGRTYDGDVIRINSQSGKGGVAYILKKNFGISMPEKMKEEVGYAIKDVSDKEHRELSPEVIYEIFKERYIYHDPYFHIDDCHFRQQNGIVCEVSILDDNSRHVILANGNGRLDAVSNAIKQYFGIHYELAVYEEHALAKGSSSKAAAYVGIVHQGKIYFGVGLDADIIKASINALVVAVNKMGEDHPFQKMEERMSEILNYIQKNYADVTLKQLAERFHLSTQYISKYIKEKSGMTFGENLKKVRMRIAKALLRSENTSVENIAASVGYENPGHFNRTFKKEFGMTPVQYRNHRIGAGGAGSASV